jgi:hypothetical protein
MRRKVVTPLPAAEGMSVADALVVLNQTIVVTMALQRTVDPNEAYDEWEANKDHLLACAQVITAILGQSGDKLNGIDFSFPEGLALGGYHVKDLDLSGGRDELPF